VAQVDIFAFITFSSPLELNTYTLSFSSFPPFLEEERWEEGKGEELGRDAGEEW
jgi:hypothetical protein